jgi:phenylacetate-CoA ligase
MRRMQKITGRTDDMIILRGVNLFPTQIEELIMGIPVLSPHFQLHPDAAKAGPQLSTLIKNTTGVTVTTNVLAPDSIERSVGKMRRIVDHRPR